MTYENPRDPNDPLVPRRPSAYGGWLPLGSVVGLGVGTGGEVDGDGAEVTVWTDGPVLVVSPVWSVVVRGYIIAITAKTTAAARRPTQAPIQ